jgi:polygalacturonase
MKSFLGLISFLTLTLYTSFAGEAKPEPSSNVSFDWENQLKTNLNQMADRLNATLKPWAVPSKIYRVEDFGAVADGKTVNTKSINKAIEACSNAGGGVVLFAHGDYVTGTIDFKSGVMIEVAADSRILGSTNIADYPERVAKRRTVMDSHMDMRQSLIFAEGCERIGIRGAGEINGRGTKQNFAGEQTIGKTPGRPFLMRVIDCRDIVIDGITLKDSACWMQNYLNCENLILQHVTVDNQANWNNDGVDIDSCRNVIVRDCLINAEDDGMCFKGAGLKPMENVLVENCKFYSTCNPLKFGTDSQGDFRNVLVRNCEVGGPSESMRAINRRKASSGISWEVVDGGTLENILATNIHIVLADSPLFLRLGNRGRTLPELPKPKPGILRRIIFENITGGFNGKTGSIFSGIPSARIEDVIVRNVDIFVRGGGKKLAPETVIPEKENAYPDAKMFGSIQPAYGFWVRHTNNVKFENILITPGEPDERPLFHFESNTQNIIQCGYLGLRNN